MVVAYFATRITHTDYISAGDVSRCFSAHAAMCAFGIHKLRQHTAEILLLGRHAEHHALGAHVPVESLNICESDNVAIRQGHVE